jgi:lipopolysaccharide export system protein LptC
MSSTGLPPDRHTGGYLIPSGAGRLRSLPEANRMARRRLLITLTKWLLPVAAMVLLALIALWPELGIGGGKARLAIGHLSGELDGGRLLDARYNGVDDKGRPYTVTAATARQLDPERVVLTMPKGDITLENGTWLMLTSRDGTFLQHLNQLDLRHDVTLYRDDGTTLHTAAASIDLKASAAAGSDPVHAEGPFGVLDAQGFAVMDKGTAIDFTGPAHLVLNGAGN